MNVWGWGGGGGVLSPPGITKNAFSFPTLPIAQCDFTRIRIPTLWTSTRGKLPPYNLPLGQLLPGQLPPRTTTSPGQLPPRTTNPRTTTPHITCFYTFFSLDPPLVYGHRTVVHRDELHNGANVFVLK